MTLSNFIFVNFVRLSSSLSVCMSISLCEQIGPNLTSLHVWLCVPCACLSLSDSVCLILSMFASAGRPSTSSCLLPLPVSASIGNYVSLLACACLTVRLSDCWSVQLSVSVYCLFPSICLSVTASLHLNLSVCPYLNLSIACLCLPAYLPVGQSQHLSVCLCVPVCLLPFVSTEHNTTDLTRQT